MAILYWARPIIEGNQTAKYCAVTGCGHSYETACSGRWPASLPTDVQDGDVLELEEMCTRCLIMTFEFETEEATLPRLALVPSEAEAL